MGCRNRPWNQVLPVLGRQVVLDLKADIERGAPVHADKVLMVLWQVFDHAKDQGWMAMDQNPALRTKGTKSKHKPTPHPTLRPLPLCQELR